MEPHLHAKNEYQHKDKCKINSNYNKFTLIMSPSLT